MSNENKTENIFSSKIRAGKRRTYFFDVRTTRANDYYLTITESRKRFNDDGYERQKLFLYKEDFNKFVKHLGEAVDYIKTELMPDFDFDAFNHDEQREEGENNYTNQPEKETTETTSETSTETPIETSIETKPNTDGLHEEVDKW